MSTLGHVLSVISRIDLLKVIGDLSGSVFTQIVLSSIRRLSFTVKMSLKRIKRNLFVCYRQMQDAIFCEKSEEQKSKPK